MGTFHVEIEIGDPQGQRYKNAQTLVDTRATYTTLPASTSRRLGMVLYTRTPFQLADGNLREYKLEETRVRVDRQSVTTFVVFDHEGGEPLLGAYTLENLRLAPAPVSRRLVPVPSLLPIGGQVWTTP